MSDTVSVPLAAVTVVGAFVAVLTALNGGAGADAADRSKGGARRVPRWRVTQPPHPAPRGATRAPGAPTVANVLKTWDLAMYTTRGWPGRTNGLVTGGKQGYQGRLPPYHKGGVYTEGAGKVASVHQVGVYTEGAG